MEQDQATCRLELRLSDALSLVILRTALSDAQDAYDDASDAHISAEDANFLTFAEGTSEVSITFEAGGNTYGGVLDISTPDFIECFPSIRWDVAYWRSRQSGCARSSG